MLKINCLKIIMVGVLSVMGSTSFAGRDVSKTRYCVIESPEADPTFGRYKLENGESINRVVKISGPINSYVLKGHLHIAANPQRGEISDFLMNRSIPNAKFLDGLKSMARTGRDIGFFRQHDYKTMGKTGTLFVEEHPNQARTRANEFRTEYQLFRKNFEDRGLLSTNAELFENISIILYGESFLRSYKNPNTKIVGIGDEPLFDQSKVALDKQNKAIEELAQLPTVSPEDIVDFRKQLWIFTESSLNSADGKASMAFSEIVDRFKDPKAKALAREALIAVQQFNALLAQRDSAMAKAMSANNRSYTPLRTLHIGAYHLPRLQSKIQAECMQELRDLNQRTIDLVLGMNKPLDMVDHLLYRGPDGQIVYPEKREDLQVPPTTIK